MLFFAYLEQNSVCDTAIGCNIIACGKQDETIQLSEDPYQSEICDKDEKHFYCEQCIKESSDEI